MSMKPKIVFTQMYFWVLILFLAHPIVLIAQIPYLTAENSQSDIYPTGTHSNFLPKSTAQTASSNPPRVRIAYIVPSNRTPQPNYKKNLQFAIEMAQMWYRNAMNQNGFGPKTFIYEPEEDSPRPKIHLVNVPETDSVLRGAENDGYGLFDRTKAAAKNAGLSVDADGEVWILIPETHVQRPSGSFYGTLALGGGGGSGNNSGVAQLGSTVIPLFDPQRLIDDTPYAGHIIPELGPYPLVQDSSFVWFEDHTFSTIASSYLGALCHEMGHAFGLNHDARQDANFFGGLMYNGLRGIRGSFFPTLFPNNYTRLEYGSSLQLNVSHYFNRNKNITTVPTLYITTGTVTPINGQLNIQMAAYDIDTLSYVLLYDKNGEVINEVSVNYTSIGLTLQTPYYTAGVNNEFYISVGDKQGNRKLSPKFNIFVNAGSNQAPKPFLKILYPNAPSQGNSTVFNSKGSDDFEKGTYTTEFDINNDGTYDTPPLTANEYSHELTQTGPYMARIRVTDAAGAFSVSSPISGNFGNTCGVDPPKITGKNKVCPSSPVQLTVYGCYGTLLWSNGETTSSIVVTPTTTTVYSVSCSYGCLAQTSLPFTVEVTPNTVTLSNISTPGPQIAPQTLISTQQIPASTTVSYFAGNSIELLPGFYGANSSVFTALIKGCNTPLANNDSFSAVPGFARTLNVLSNDFTPDGIPVSNFSEVLLPEILAQPTKGTVTINPNGSFTYTPNENASGTDSFVYSLCNKFAPSFCANAQVNIDLNYLNPVVNAGFETTVTFNNPPWQKGGWKTYQAVFSWLSGQGRNGSHGIKIYSGPPAGPVVSNDVYVYQAVTLAPNTNYSVHGWVKTENVTTNSNPNGVGACLSLIIAGNNWPPISSHLKGTNDWTRLSLSFNSGATGTVTIACRLGYANADSEGTAFFDDLIIVPQFP